MGGDFDHIIGAKPPPYVFHHPLESSRTNACMSPFDKAVSLSGSLVF